MARLRFLCAAFALVSLSASADPPDALPAHAATSPNQSLSIEESSPGRNGVTAGPSNVQPDSYQPVAVPTAQAMERAPVFLGKKKSSAESNAFASESADTPWYRTGLGALALVLGLIGVLYTIVRRWSPSLKLTGSGTIQVVGRTVIGPRQSFVLVQLGRRLVLVGVSAERMERICEVADGEEVAAILSESRRSRGAFSSWLDQEAAEFTKAGTSEAGAEVSRPRQLTQLLQRLRTAKV